MQETPSPHPSRGRTIKAMTSRTQQHHRVVITGMGAVTNLGQTAPETWDAMRAGRNGISLIEAPFIHEYDGWSVKIAGQVKDFDFSVAIDPRDARKLDRSTQLGMVAAEEAVKQSGLDFNTGPFERRGVVFGSGVR